ncbi:hypothetical protein IFVP182_C260234 [Vibrio parahaemolyticus]
MTKSLGDHTHDLIAELTFGQKRVSDFAKLAFNGLPEIRQNLDLSAHFYSSTKNNRGNVLRIPFPINN